MIKTDRPSKLFGMRTSALIEIAAFFIILTLGALLFGKPLNYIQVTPHPYWIVVILISAQYGTVEGLLAAFVASIFYFLGTFPERNILQDRSEYFYLLAKTPILWFVSAVILGELRMKHIRETAELQKKADEAKEQEKKIAESYSALKKIKERLEMRVASEMQTTLAMITTFKRLEERGKEGVIQGAFELTKTLIAPEKFSIYLLEDGELKKVAAEDWEKSDHYAHQFNTESPLFNEIVRKRNMVSYSTSNLEILGKEGVVAVPIIDPSTKEVFGMIKVEQIPFLRLRTSVIESLKTIGEWVGKAYNGILEKEGK